MFGFTSNFNDIQKQIAVADLTDEQIQELVATLQTRRSARPELTKEERVFFQCCRERRSYAIIKIWMPLSALIVALSRLSSTERAKADRDICVRIAEKHSGIPTVQLLFVPSCLSVNGLSLSS